MKKLMFGLIAIVFAVGFTAFTTLENKSTLSNVVLYFDYVNFDEFDETDVETSGAWKENVTPITCAGSNAACKIEVAPANTTGSAGSRVLSTSVTIVASGSGILGYKPNTQAALLVIENKP